MRFSVWHVLASVVVCGGILFLISLTAPTTQAAFGDASISGAFGGSTITLKTSARFAGTVYSLTWNGKEFLNSYDHGRELQSALSFDGKGEAYNPTEAGTVANGAGQTSSSKLLALSASPGTIASTIQMAYWYPVNGQILSNYIVAKTIKMGFNGIPNVIEESISFTVPQQHTSGTFEVLTAYTPPDFSSFYTYDPATRTRTVLSHTAGEQKYPVILATPDAKYAIGVYSPGLPQGGSGYGRFDFSTLPGAGNATNKWNCVYRVAPVIAYTYTMKCFVVVGTLAQVESAMDQLHAYWSASTAPNNQGMIINKPGSYTFTVPKSYKALRVAVYGSGGGGGGQSSNAWGGKGSVGRNSAFGSFVATGGGGGGGGYTPFPTATIATCSATTGTLGTGIGDVGSVISIGKGSAGGAGGGSGGCPGKAGGAGGLIQRGFVPGELPSSLSLVIGAGGAGGASNNTTPGKVGINGRIGISWK